MARKLVSRASFSDLAGVNASSITKAAQGALKAACVGKKIDANHPAAIAYIRDKSVKASPPPAEGIDPVYEQAIKACREAGKWTQSHIMKSCKVGKGRAKKLHDQMKAAGVIGTEKSPPKNDNPEPPPVEQPDKPEKMRGQAVAREKKKSGGDPRNKDYEIPEYISDYADMTLREIIYRHGTDVAFADFLKALKEIETIEEKRIKTAKAKGELVSRKVVKEGVLDNIDSFLDLLLHDGSKTLSVRVPALSKSGKSNEEVEKYISDQITKFIIPMKKKIKSALQSVQ